MTIKQIKITLDFSVPLKQLGNFSRSLKMPLINCEIELALTWSKNCVVLSNERRDVIAATETNAENVSNVKPAVNVSTTFETQICMFQLSLCQKKMAENF